jgi:hypothetical protein
MHPFGHPVQSVQNCRKIDPLRQPFVSCFLSKKAPLVVAVEGLAQNLLWLWRFTSGAGFDYHFQGSNWSGNRHFSNPLLKLSTGDRT